MAYSHQKKFDNPSIFFVWGYKLANLLLGRKYYSELVNILNLKGNESILEFGSGLGFLAERLAKKLTKSGSLTLIDISKALITRTQHKLQRFDNINYLIGEISEKKISQNSFDFIVSTWVIHHLRPELRENTIEKLVSLLKPQGKILIIEFPDSNNGHSDLSIKDLKELFKKFGLESRIIFTKKHGVLIEFSRT